MVDIHLKAEPKNNRRQSHLIVLSPGCGYQRMEEGDDRRRWWHSQSPQETMGLPVQGGRKNDEKRGYIYVNTHMCPCVCFLVSY